MGLQRIPVGDFSGGVNYKDSPFELDPDEARDALNVTLLQRGVIAQRAGTTRLDTSGYPAANFTDHVRPWYFSTTKLLMASIGGDVWSMTQGGVLTKRFESAASTPVWCFESSVTSANVNQLWMMNGNDPPQKWDGAAALTSAWAGTPPAGTMCRVWNNRMIIAGVAATPQRLFFSAIGDPETPITGYGTNWVDIKGTEDDTDPITWIEVCGPYLLVFKKNSVWKVYDSTTFANVRLGGPGCEDRFQSCVNEGICYYFNRSGVWSTNGVSAPKFESEVIEPWFQANLNYANLARVRMCASKDRRVFLSVPVGVSAMPNRLLELVPHLASQRSDGRNRAPWLIHDIAMSALAVFRPANTDELVGGGSAAGQIYRLFQGTSDDGNAISSFWKSGWRPFLSEEPFERVRRVNVELGGQITFDLYQEFAEAPVFSATLISNVDPDPFWDGGVWDGGTWDPIVSVALKRARPEKRGRYHSFGVRNADLNKTFTIYAMEFVIRGGKEH